ncbi:DNA replication factor Cdt1 [Nymphon striatum]|nr:DNA replication factor Cdt1 [Nymphon striatum]
MPQVSITNYYHAKKKSSGSGIKKNILLDSPKGIVATRCAKLTQVKVENSLEPVTSDTSKLVISTTTNQPIKKVDQDDIDVSYSLTRSTEKQCASPKRHHSPDEECVKVGKRRKKEHSNELKTPKTKPNTIFPEIKGSARKKLNVNVENDEDSKDEESTLAEATKLENIFKDTISELPKCISPLPLTPEHKKAEKKSFDIPPSSSTIKNIDKESEKLNPADIKKKLKACGKLAELQERLSKFKDCSKQLKELKSNHPYSPTKHAISSKPSPGKISPIGSPRKARIWSSPVKRQLYFPEAKPENETIKEVKSAPAYQRFHTLSSPVSQSLTLPFRYKLLIEIFRCVDTVVSMLHNRHEMCTFSKIKKAVEEMMRKAFADNRLAQIKSAFPIAYFFKQEKKVKKYEISVKEEYDLTVLPNLNIPENKAKITPEYVQQLFEENPDNKQNIEVLQVQEPMNASCLLYRRNVFHHNLLEMVKKHHNDFLLSLNPPIHINPDKLTVWHPNFKIDEIPDVPLAHLPLPPIVKTYCNAKEVLDKALSINGSGSKVEKALKKVIEQNNSEICPEIEKKALNNTKVENSALKGISESLLMKIRAKEAATNSKKMIQDPAEVKKNVMISRLPDFIRIIRTFYVCEKKVALPIDDVIKKVSESYSSNLTTRELEQHLELLSTVLPTWLMILKIKKGVFVKIDKNKNLSTLYNQVNRLQK